MRVSSGFLTTFYNVGAQVLRRWHFLFSLVFVVIKHMHSDTGLKVTFVFCYKQTFFHSDKVSLCKPASLIRFSCTIISATRNL